MSLSDLKCKSSKPKEKVYKIYDSNGLYLEVTPTGSKRWRFKYRFCEKEKRLSFGLYPQTTLLDARGMRENAKNLIRQNIDPSFARKENDRLEKLKSAETVEQVAREWHGYQITEWSKDYAATVLHRLEVDIFPFIGHYPISKLSAPVLFQCIQRIEERGAKDMAKRALQVCGQFMRYAVVTAKAERDFTTDMKGTLKKHKKGHYAAISSDELPDFIKTLNRNEHRLFPQTISAIKLLMLTFVRTNELIQATWDEFDFKKKEWNIPGHRMKMRHPHIVPLSKQSLEILLTLKKDSKEIKYIFPSIINPRNHISDGTINSALKKMGYHGKMTGHGFRSLAMSTIKEKLKYRHEVVDRQLAHSPKNSVDKAYDRAKFLPDRKIMMQKWADYIDKNS